jgi:hypothetical protein
VVCGISFGYSDRDHKANSHRTRRASIDETARFVDNWQMIRRLRVHRITSVPENGTDLAALSAMRPFRSQRSR